MEARATSNGRHGDGRRGGDVEKNGENWILGECISRHRPNYIFTLVARVRWCWGEGSQVISA